jgi:hypothetical protein
MWERKVCAEKILEFVFNAFPHCSQALEWYEMQHDNILTHACATRETTCKSLMTEALEKEFGHLAGNQEQVLWSMKLNKGAPNHQLDCMRRLSYAPHHLKHCIAEAERNMPVMSMILAEKTRHAEGKGTQ